MYRPEAKMPTTEPWWECLLFGVVALVLIYTSAWAIVKYDVSEHQRQAALVRSLNGRGGIR